MNSQSINNNQQKNCPIDGVIKFKCNHIKAEPLNYEQNLKKLNEFRQKLYDINLIGEYDLEKVGFGNISQRILNTDQFIITGSSTGKIKNLNENHYCVVDSFDLDTNSLSCQGPIIASSESMTHGQIYKQNKNIQVVIHIHNFQMWENLLHKIPTTNKEVQYGTPEMGKEVQRLFNETNVQKQKCFVLEGHKDGIFSFGSDFQEAFDIVYTYYKKYILGPEEQ